MKQVLAKNTERFVLVVKASDDRMKVFIDLEPVPPRREEAPPSDEQNDKRSAPEPTVLEWPVITSDEVINCLRECMNTSYLHDGVLEDICRCVSRGESVHERRIAKGVPPEQGGDGKVLFLVKRLTGEVEIKVDARGVADLKTLNLFDNISKGTKVGRIYPPKAGVDGRDALGKTLPAKPGKPYKAAIDRSLRLVNPSDSSETYQTLVAEIDGYVQEESGKLAIKGELVVGGDLDYHLGVIDFIGSVRINGSVLPGFSIKAKNGIIITGSVHEASLVCPEGDIVVHHYVYGGETSRVVAGKNFECAVAHELDVEAVGNITVHKEAIDCDLRSQASVIISQGHLVGGRTLAVCGVEAKQIGNDAGQPTRIQLCSDVEMSSEFLTLISQIENHERALRMIDLHLGPFATNPARIEVLHGAYREKMRRMFEKKREIELSLGKLLGKKSEMLVYAHTNSVLRVNFLQRMYEGVVVNVGQETFSPEHVLDGPASLDYVASENSFKIGELKGLECHVERGK